MSRKWLQKEGEQWVQKEIISHDQYEKIVQLYPETSRISGILPILASILVGIGILSFIASNWDQITDWIRLAIICIAVLGFYFWGERSMQRGSQTLGISLVGLGLISFGAGIFLVGQMFNLASYDVTPFIVWALAGIVLVFLYPNAYLYLLTLIILHIGQLYSVNSFNNSSFIILGLLVVGLGYYCWKQKQALMTWFFALSVLLQSTIVTLNYFQDMSFLWLTTVALVLYVAGEWLRQKSFSPLQYSASIFTFLFTSILVLTLQFSMHDRLPNPIAIILSLVVLLGLSYLAKSRKGDLASIADWILYIPFFYLPKDVSGVMYLLAMYVFSGSILWRGYQNKTRFIVNLGIILFLYTTFIGYIHLAWSFLNKSIFFLIGGLILFILNWFLSKRKQQFFDERGGE